jgi:hypothetical protein
MQYRLVYDALSDDYGFPWLGAAFTTVPCLLAIVCILKIIRRVRGGRALSAPRVPGRISLEATPLALVIAAFLIPASDGVFLAWQTYEGFMERQRCRELARAGQGQVTEGTIADYQYRKAGARYTIASVSFDLLERSAGFTGRFNVPGAGHVSLCDGLGVRLTHREGFILRDEIAREPAD